VRKGMLLGDNIDLLSSTMALIYSGTLPVYTDHIEL
jgi:hypothetical protein